jgi:hypothetical protein
VFEQGGGGGGGSGKAPVVDLSSSSDEEDSIPDTSRNFELTQRLYGELNRGLLGPPGDGNVIILSNSNEEEEAHEETTADAKATPSAAVVKPSTLAASPANADEDPEATPNESNDGLALGSDTGKSSGGGDKASAP